MEAKETTEARKERYGLIVRLADDMMLRYQLSLAVNSIELDFLGNAPEALVMFKDTIGAELYRRKEMIDAPDAV